MKDDKLLSIIIPTKNRQVYAIKCVEQILQIKDTRLQVVIQDNSDNEGLQDDLKQLTDDTRIKYNYTKGEISFVDNFGMGVDLADGEYLCIIGDDDGVTPFIIDVVNWAKTNNIDAIKPEVLFEYFWPNSIDMKGQAQDGLIRLVNAPIKAKKCNAYYEVLELLKNGGQHYTTLNMVKLYHGIVRKACIEKIRDITGQYFGGLSPDIYMAVALSITAKTVIQLNYPLTIAGVCGKSGSADSSKGRHVGALEDAPHFRGHDKYEWSKKIPEFYSVETIWADSALAAINDLKRDDLIEKFKLSSLASCCIGKHPEFKNIIKDHYTACLKNDNVFQKLLFALEYFIYPINDFLKKVKRRLKRMGSELILIKGVADIIAANDEYKKVMISNDITVSLVLEALNRALISKKYQ